MSIKIDSWCSECERDRSKWFSSLKKVKIFKCKVCGQDQYACNLCDLLNVTHCGNEEDGGCAFYIRMVLLEIEKNYLLYFLIETYEV